MSAQTATAGGDPMDVAATTPNTSDSPNGPQGHDSDADGRSNDRSKSSPTQDQSAAANAVNMPAPPPAAAAIHQPKIVQTAFIHKLYNMLEDQNIQHLISWSASADSFVMSPSPDFSKVLSYVVYLAIANYLGTARGWDIELIA
jgi:hypothetical protein